jgi:DNA polymerase III subunit delta
MVAVAPNNAERFCASPPDQVRLFLLYGSDPGAITERARRIEQVAQLRGGEIVRFGSDELSLNPARIVEEACSPLLFGGEPVISLRVLDARHNVLGALKELLQQPPSHAWLVVEAGELKRESPLLKAFTDCPQAAAIPTYPLEGTSLVSFIHSAALDAGLSVDAEAVELLTEQLGGDRLAARSELEKLFAYAQDAGMVTAAHVNDLIGDASTSAPEEIGDAALSGDPEKLDSAFQRFRAAGGSPAALGSQVLRQLIALWGMRAMVESGASVRTALDRVRPPVYPRRREAVEAVLKRWPTGELTWARRVLNQAVAESRYLPALESALVANALSQIAARAQSLAR